MHHNYMPYVTTGCGEDISTGYSVSSPSRRPSEGFVAMVKINIGLLVEEEDREEEEEGGRGVGGVGGRRRIVHPPHSSP